MKITLAPEPVDGTTVRWFEIDGLRLRHRSAVYHANTPWAAYAPMCPGGVDLVDDWMIYEGTHCGGRVEGWTALATWLAWRGVVAFDSEQRAREVLSEKIKRSIEQADERLRELRSAQVANDIALLGLVER